MTMRNQRTVRAQCDLKFGSLCDGIEHVVKTSVKERLAAGEVEGADPKLLTLGDGWKHELHRQLLPAPRRAFHVAMEALEVAATQQMQHQSRCSLCVTSLSCKVHLAPQGSHHNGGAPKHPPL